MLSRALLGSLPINLVNALIIYVIIVPRAVPIEMSFGGRGGGGGGGQTIFGPLKRVITFGAPYNMLCSVQPDVMSVCDIITYKVFHC